MPTLSTPSSCPTSRRLPSELLALNGSKLRPPVTRAYGFKRGGGDTTLDTPLKFNMVHLKISPWKRRFLLEIIIFHVKLWGWCTLPKEDGFSTGRTKGLNLFVRSMMGTTAMSSPVSIRAMERWMLKLLHSFEGLIQLQSGGHPNSPFFFRL